MKNIQIVSSTDATHDGLFAATEDEFALFFRDGENIAFMERLAGRVPRVQLFAALSRVLARPLIAGPGIVVHGVLFYHRPEGANEPI